MPKITLDTLLEQMIAHSADVHSVDRKFLRDVKEAIDEARQDAAGIRAIKARAERNALQAIDARNKAEEELEAHLADIRANKGRKEELASAVGRIDDLTRERDKLNATIADKDGEVADLRRTIDQLNAEIASLRKRLQIAGDKHVEVMGLVEQIYEVVGG